MRSSDASISAFITAFDRVDAVAVEELAEALDGDVVGGDHALEVEADHVGQPATCP